MLDRPELCITVKFRIQEGGGTAGVVLGKTLVLVRSRRCVPGVPGVINSCAEGRLKVPLQGGESEGRYREWLAEHMEQLCLLFYDKLKHCTVQTCTNETLQDD